MLRPHRHIPHRLAATLLAVLMLAFPAAGSGMFETCAVDHGSAASCVEADISDCCVKDQADARQDSSDHSPAPSGCGKCLHACCRAADAVFVRTQPLLERALVSPLLLPLEAVHAPLTCDAIFHPPRAV